MFRIRFTMKQWFCFIIPSKSCFFDGLPIKNVGQRWFQRNSQVLTCLGQTPITGRWKMGRLCWMWHPGHLPLCLGQVSGAPIYYIPSKKLMILRTWNTWNRLITWIGFEDVPKKSVVYCGQNHLWMTNGCGLLIHPWDPSRGAGAGGLPSLPRDGEAPRGDPGEVQTRGSEIRWAESYGW